MVLMISPVPDPTYTPASPRSGIKRTTPEPTNAAPATTIICIGLNPNCNPIKPPMINGVANWKITASCAIVTATGYSLKYFKIAPKTAFGISPTMIPVAVPANTLFKKILGVNLFVVSIYLFLLFRL